MMTFKHTIIILLTTIALGLNTALATEEPLPATQKTYTFHTALQSPIKEILEGRITEAFRRLGLQGEVRVQPSAQRALILANEEGDGDAGRVTNIKTIAPNDTTNLIQIPTPIISLTLNVYTKDISFPVTSWESLRGYHNGARLGAKILEKNIPDQRTFLPTTIQLVKMLDAGRIDTMVEWDLIADHAIKKLDMQLKKLSPPIIKQPFHIYLHKKHRALVPRLNKVLQQMQGDGSLSNTTTDFVFYTGVQSPLKEVLENRLQEAFRRAGDFKFKLINPGSAQRALVLANEEGDGDANRVVNLKKIAPTNTTKLIPIPEPINFARFFVYSNGAVKTIKDYNSLSNFRNGFRCGVKILEKNIPGQQVILPDTTRLLQMLNDGRIDTVVEWPTIADTLITKNNYPNIVKLSTPLINLPCYAYIHQKHHALIPRLVQAIQAMKQDGTFTKIKEDAQQQVLNLNNNESPNHAQKY